MATFLLEVGTEELPADFVADAVKQWRTLIPQTLAANNLTNDAIHVYATPRRLAVLIQGLPPQQSDRFEEIKGPPAAAAFKNGQPTKAAEGFAKKQGVELAALEIRPTDKGDFVFIRKTIAGRPTADILRELAPQWIFSLEGKRLMRWADGDLKFPRPIRWLVALLEENVLPIELNNGSQSIKSDRISRGHRILHPQPVTIPHAINYPEILHAAFVEVAPEERKIKIRRQVEAAAEKIGGVANINPDLLEEVNNLVEWPTAVVGKFDDDFLILPPEVITTVMITHQRYFPVLKSQGTPELLHYFITISNGDPEKSDIIAAGNERVIRARLADGQFFYKTDLAKPLESYVAQLETVTFQEDLGTVRDKVTRLSKNAELIAEQLKLSESERATIARAALLCKADLVTQMVYEFPELQGVMGEKYARASGESEAVARAIFEHYLPRSASDRLPETIAGQVVGFADRLDTLVCIFGLGMLPTGSSDPFALRRAATAIINITWAANLPINLYELLQQIVADFIKTHPKTSPDLLQQLSEFFLLRIRTLLQEERGIDYDLVNAVLGENDPEYAERALKDLLDVRERAIFLQKIRKNGKLDEIYETVNRSARLAKQGDLNTVELNPTAVVRKELFQKSSEKALYEALVQLLPKTRAAQQTRDYQQLVNAIAEITPTVSRFFDGADSVLVMDENPDIRRNRLNLLGLLRNHARVLADFGAIVKS
ncbi:MAG: glycine--tRNA ligase subunit beta [Oscillatoriaceae bacterium SKW80]|nr:glycine--tRNA ligase subunit beta [Oscillatoriaceae bacterium SKYG93]MCX8122045.1 glycine--tRNA ligase subunit beta [Oscillatoriaceae bacterium SKW80]MDW8454332.1 glycine--tRNA ligase subunit beta [Oscillatoriaceae cyanobacterium SKYGB_i_bin93]HIK29196.1 glycine--tRNA ligase subunit beta [Oscillatoriaceae cyanobacterium M7585_C2015_266]